MALPPTFTARVRTSVVPVAANAPDMSPIAQGLSLLGRTGTQAVQQDHQADQEIADSQAKLQVEQQKRDRSQKAIAFGAQLGEANITFMQRVEEARGQTDPGAPGWTDKVRTIASDVFSPLSASYSGDDELAATVAPQLQKLVNSHLADEAVWQVKENAAWQGQQHAIGLQADADGVMGKPTPENAAAAIERQDKLIELTDFDGTTKAKLHYNVRGVIFRSMLDGMGQAEQYDQMDALLASGTLDGAIGEDKDNYLRTVEAGRAAQARQADIDAHQQQDQAKQTLDLIKVQIQHGDDVPQSQISAALKAGKAAGIEPADLAGYAYLGEEMVNRRQFRTMTDSGLQQEVTALQAKQSTGHLDDAGTRRLEQAKHALGDRDQAKGEKLGELWRSGQPGQLQAVQQLAALPLDRRFAAADKMGQPRAAIYAALGGNGQLAAVQGRAVREARPDDFLPAKGDQGKKVADQQFRAVLGDDLTRQLGGSYDEVRETALDLMAGTAGKWDPRSFERAVQITYGWNRGADGLVRGGIAPVRGRKVEIPANITAQSFERALVASDFGAARYRGGQPASKADVLANYLPVPSGPTDAGGRTPYMFLDKQGNPLLDASGKNPFAIYFFPHAGPR